MYGQHDCALWVGHWVQLVTGRDGGAEWAGTYDSEEACLALLDREGGLLAVMARGAATAGLQLTRTSRRGDIAVVGVRVLRGEPLVAAICTGEAWAALSGRGIRYIRGTPVAAWRVPLD